MQKNDDKPWSTMGIWDILFSDQPKCRIMDFPIPSRPQMQSEMQCSYFFAGVNGLGLVEIHEEPLCLMVKTIVDWCWLQMFLKPIRRIWKTDVAGKGNKHRPHSCQKTIVPIHP